METEEKGVPLSLVPWQQKLEVVREEVFFCKFCGKVARQPVLNVICGHLFCWCCLYRDVKRKRRKGLRQCCPWCSCHVAISPPRSTVIRVCGGPQCGAVSCPDGIDYEKKQMGKKVEKKLKVKGVPRRPWYDDASRYPTVSAFICSLFIGLRSKSMSICDCLKLLCNGKAANAKGYIKIIRKYLCNAIQDLEDGAVWLTGQEDSKVSKTTTAITNKKNALNRKGNKISSKGNVKIITRPLVKLQMSSRFFFNRKLRSSRLKKQHLLEDLDKQSAESKAFSCTICCKRAYEPVASKSGHLFCWTCLYSKGELPSVGCPVAELSVCIVSGEASVSPIYYSVEYEKEDALLIANRITGEHQMDNDITQIPTRARPTIAVEFLDIMINKVREEGEAITKILDNVLDWHDQEEKENICRKLQGRINALFVWLVNAWRRKSKEQENEEKYGLKLMTKHIVKDEYYEAAWQNLGVENGQVSHEQVTNGGGAEYLR